MARILFIGLWVLVVALASTYGGSFMKSRRAAAPAEAHQVKLEVKKVRPITVPVIGGGALKGYVAADLSLVMEAADKHGGDAGIDPESFVMDEAFRIIYSESKTDFTHIEKVDVDALTKQITERVNARLGVARIKETLVKGLTFVPKEDLPR